MKIISIYTRLFTVTVLIGYNPKWVKDSSSIYFNILCDPRCQYDIKNDRRLGWKIVFAEFDSETHSVSNGTYRLSKLGHGVCIIKFTGINIWNNVNNMFVSIIMCMFLILHDILEVRSFYVVNFELIILILA